MSEGKIMYAELAGTYVIHPVGNIRYTISRGLDRLIKRIQEDAAAKDVVVDLEETEFMDSTNLGLLAKLASITFKKIQRYPQLISNNRNINMVLDSMGFQQIFNLTCKSPGFMTPDQPLEEVGDDSGAAISASELLEAHRQLSDMNDKNAETFHDVIELLSVDAGS